MPELIIGAVAALAATGLVRYARSHSLEIAGWQWLLTALGFLYAMFILEVIVAFLREGTPKGAVVMGTLLGFIAVVWGVLLARFVFRGPARPISSPPETGGGV